MATGIIGAANFVAFVMWRVVNPGLHAALDVHCSCRWVDPPGRHKYQRGKRTNEHHAGDKSGTIRMCHQSSERPFDF
jgi:hypothetical protein